MQSPPQKHSKEFEEILNKQIIDRTVDHAKPAIFAEISAILEKLKMELVELLPESAQGIVAELIGLDMDPNDKTFKERGDLFDPVRRKIQHILDRVKEAIHDGIHFATQYTAKEATDTMERSIKIALRKWKEEIKSDSPEQKARALPAPTPVAQLPPPADSSREITTTSREITTTSREITTSSIESTTTDSSRGIPGGGGDSTRGDSERFSKSKFVKQLAVDIFGQKGVQKITKMAEETGMIQWASEHVDRVIVATLEMVRPEITNYVTRETSGVGSKVTSVLREHLDRAIDEHEEKSKSHNFIRRMFDKARDGQIREMFDKVQGSFAEKAEQFIKWVMGKLLQAVMWLTENKLRLELDKLPGVRVWRDMKPLEFSSFDESTAVKQ